MKRAMIVVLVMLVLAAISFAQSSYVSGSNGGIPFNIDKLGAHQNGGRGCTGCHAPHGGAKGGGGNATGNQGIDPDSGKRALWGQDVTPLLGYTFQSGDQGAWSETLPGTSTIATANGITTYTNTGVDYTSGVGAEVTGLMFCLSCHDGNIAKGAMMTNGLYEQRINVLPTGLYGPQTIPTLLGNDGTTIGNYNNDHPVGVGANLGAVGVGQYFTTTATGVAYNQAAGNSIGSGAAAGGFDKFVNNYGLPSFRGVAAVGVPTAGYTSANQAFVVCTTCHTPHTMYIAFASPSNPYGGLTAGAFPTYFFLVGPYNPGSLSLVNDGTKASSATQFCRQCHFSGAGGANESVGIDTVTTAW